ncbi:MAG: chromate efflux transporter [Candidatus Latescibacteria bacterium]|nr:chromate efflux transporter [Candidatus Latescibacterota bacterium]
MSRGARLRELAGLFLRLGALSFGGPAAHNALMRTEVVHRRGWLTDAEFLDLMGATNLIPGPNSTELAIHIGHRRAGRPGLLVAGACFILPAVLITLVFAWAYVRFGALPRVAALLDGVKPVIVAIVAHALWGMSRSVLKRPLPIVLAVGSLLALLAGVNELLVLAGAGLAALATRLPRLRRPPVALLLGLGGFLAAASRLPAAAVAGAAEIVARPFALSSLFLFFLKVGSVLFGSGYVLIAFLRADLVDRWRWLTESQLLDAVAVGQVTPGPLFSTATFIGYLLGGVPGAMLATLGIFLPAFVFVALSGPLVPRLRRSPTAGAFLDGVVAASLALMAAVSWQIGRAAVRDVPAAILATLALLLLARTRVGSLWLVLGGGLAGLALQGLG